MDIARLIRIIGKTKQDATRQEINLTTPVVHPAICHMIDVALVAKELLSAMPHAQKRWLRRFFSCPDDQTENWLLFFGALHDLGKISPGFQRKCARHIQGRNTKDISDYCKNMLSKLKQKGFPFSPIGELEETDHGRITFETLPDLWSTAHPSVSFAMARMLGGHHGKFPEDRAVQHRRLAGDVIWNKTRKDAIELLLSLFEVSEEEFPFVGHEFLEAPFLMFLAGLTSVSDWIGSDVERFSFVGVPDDDFDLSKYLKKREKVAQEAISQLNLDHPPLWPGKSKFADLFPFSPNFCQKAALEVAAKLDSTSLIIIETPMGSGKTEAALAIADKWIRQCGAGGLYYALPTQATGNKMFKRIKKFLLEHPGVHETELHLLHGFSDLQEDYAELKLSSIHGEGSDSNISAHEWFTNRKRGLLSHFAVGTVDQALMAVLQVRHMFVRLFGLAGKVVVIDEVHAYDTYTSTLLDRLLAWLSALGTPAILLSATLPAKRRNELLLAYARPQKSLPSTRYPSVCGIDNSGSVISHNIPDAPEQCFKLRAITKDENWKDLVKQILSSLLEEGGCAACIMNTVAEAQKQFEYLKQELSFQGDTIFILFHARLPARQKMEIEEEIDFLFGPGKDEVQPNSNRPGRAVVIATQVLEQSLDVDFDWMLTDLAPVDLMLQRAGRLHRHRKNDYSRPSSLSSAELCYLNPNLSVTQPDFGDNEKIYEPAVLLKTALSIKDGMQIKLPDSLQENSLIERVYGLGVDCPEHLQTTLEDWEMLARWTDNDITFEARKYAVPAPEPGEDGDELLRDLAASTDDELIPASVRNQTRLARPSITIIILYRNNGSLFLTFDYSEPLDIVRRPGRQLIRLLMGNSISISNPVWYEYFCEQPVHKPWEKTPLLRYCRPAVFDDLKLKDGKRKLRIDPELGVIF
ncbi:MAG: CRISPR-associated helicase Cas3' [Deltaproteobacteria bacterium]|nr:CRISPR-associated helicase Cas3' [Deltaproteobacteria bacterium]